VNNVPFLILRAISDGADDQSNMDFPTFARMAAEHSADALSEMLRRM
jgi:nucleoside phosphorylase